MEHIDALVMGRNSFEMVDATDCDWPYTKPVFVLSNQLTSLPNRYHGKASLLKGAPAEIIKTLNQDGHKNIYIDGGKVIQSFLQEDSDDEMIITAIPILLGGGSRLFGDLMHALSFSLTSSQIFSGKIMQSRFKRERN